MFSGFTNQVTSWIGAAKGEPQDEEVPVPTANSNQQQQAPPENIQEQGQQPVAEGQEDAEKGQRFAKKRKIRQKLENFINYQYDDSFQ